MEFEKNPDGTDKLDEQGNPIPVKVTDDKEKEFAKVKNDLVSEITELRTKLQVAQGLLDKKNEPDPDPNHIPTDEEKLEALLDRKIKERDALNAKANKTAAFEKFVTEHKEFDSENDPTGLKRKALQDKFDSFNTSNLSKVEEFLSVIGDAKTLLLGNDSQVDTTKDRQNLYSNPGKLPNNPPAKRNDELSSKELKLIAQSGVTKEKIMKLKATNPEYLAGLLEYVRD